MIGHWLQPMEILRSILIGQERCQNIILKDIINNKKVFLVK